MTGLHARLSWVIGASIAVVVFLAAIITFQITDGPRQGLFEESYAQTVRAMSLLSAGESERLRAAGMAIKTRPNPDLLDREATDLLQSALRRQGSDLDAMIFDTPEGGRRVVVPAEDGNLASLDFPPRPPQPWTALISYLSFVALGTITVSSFGARRILGPVRLLDRAVASVRFDGILPRIPETGPAEIRATARTLNELSDRLSTATESRMRLIAAAGHDLRTPMTRMRLRAEFLPDGDREPWLRDLAELDAIADSAIRLVREEADPTSFEPVLLPDLISEIVGDMVEIGLPARFNADAAHQTVVAAQPLALKRALRNIVENAATHGLSADVSIHLSGAAAVVRIDDAGPGIPEVLLARVFEPFFQVEPSRARRVPQVGLGLAIAREIVDRHGGMISIENRPGGGLRQEVRLAVRADL